MQQFVEFTAGLKATASQKTIATINFIRAHESARRLEERKNQCLQFRPDETNISFGRRIQEHPKVFKHLAWETKNALVTCMVDIEKMFVYYRQQSSSTI